MKKADRDSGRRPGIATDVADKLKALERENRELRQANEILRKASAYFAQAELDRRFLLGSCPDISATFTTVAFDDGSLRWFEINT